MKRTPHPTPDETESLVRRYVGYLRQDRGLAGNSLLVYTPFIRDLLAGQVAKTGFVSTNASDAATIRSFLLEHIRGHSAEYARLLVTALRSFFRFLFLCGDLPTDLSGAAPMCGPSEPL